MDSSDGNGKELWDIQEEFTKKFWATKGGMPNYLTSDKIMTGITKDYALHIITEVTEVVQELSWKMHRNTRDSIDRDNVLEEMIDVTKFLFGLMQVWGFTWEDFAEEFKRKSSVVEQRFAQDQSFPNLVNHPVAIVDIDGVLSDYPNCFYDWIKDNVKELGNSITSRTRAKFLFDNTSITEQEIWKRDYRRSGVKADLPVLPGAKEFLSMVRSRGLKVILLTNRPYDEHYRIYPDTLEWLSKNDLQYDGILWARDKGLEAVKNFKNICWAVDDTEKNIKRLQEARITTIRVNPSDDTRNTAALLQFSKNVKKIEDLGWDWSHMVTGSKSFPVEVTG